jgi:hypothetical protein
MRARLGAMDQEYGSRETNKSLSVLVFAGRYSDNIGQFGHLIENYQLETSNIAM